MSQAVDLEISYIPQEGVSGHTQLWKAEGIPGVEITIYLYERSDRGNIYLVDVEANKHMLHILKDLMPDGRTVHTETHLFEANGLDPEEHTDVQRIVSSFVNLHQIGRAERAM